MVKLQPLNHLNHSEHVNFVDTNYQQIEILGNLLMLVGYQVVHP